MWFKNLQLYRLPRGFEYSPEQLHDKLQERAFRPCGSLEAASYGWVPPLGREGTQLTHGSGGFVMVCARKEERVLPGQVVREELADKVSAIEAQQGRPVSRKEQQPSRTRLCRP